MTYQRYNYNACSNWKRSKKEELYSSHQIQQRQKKPKLLYYTFWVDFMIRYRRDNVIH